MGENHKNGNRKEPLSVELFWFTVVWATRMFVVIFPFGDVPEDSWLGQYYNAPWMWIVFAASLYIGFILPCVVPDRPQWAELRSYCPWQFDKPGKKDKE